MKRWLGLAAFLAAGFYMTGALVIGDGAATLTVEPFKVTAEAHLPNIGWLPSLFPGTAPIPDAGLRVLIVEETADRTKMPQPQQEILASLEVRDYLASHAAKGADGKTPEFRIFDKDVDASHESKIWQAAMQRPRQSLPWLLISNGKSGFEGPLPADVPTFMALVKKYGGA